MHGICSHVAAVAAGVRAVVCANAGGLLTQSGGVGLTHAAARALGALCAPWRHHPSFKWMVRHAAWSFLPENSRARFLTMGAARPLLSDYACPCASRAQVH